MTTCYGTQLSFKTGVLYKWNCKRVYLSSSERGDDLETTNVILYPAGLDLTFVGIGYEIGWVFFVGIGYEISGKGTDPLSSLSQEMSAYCVHKWNFHARG